MGLAIRLAGYYGIVWRGICNSCWLFEDVDGPEKWTGGSGRVHMAQLATGSPVSVSPLIWGRRKHLSGCSSKAKISLLHADLPFPKLGKTNFPQKLSNLQQSQQCVKLSQNFRRCFQSFLHCIFAFFVWQYFWDPVAWLIYYQCIFDTQEPWDLKWRTLLYFLIAWSSDWFLDMKLQSL